MTRLKKWEVDNPEYKVCVMNEGERLVSMAGDNDVDGIKQCVLFLQEGEMLIWYVVRMFLAAMRQGNVTVMEYMIDNGLDIHFPPFKDIIFDITMSKTIKASNKVEMLQLLKSKTGLSLDPLRYAPYMNMMLCTSEHPIYIGVMGILHYY